MTPQPTSRNPWRWIAGVAILALVAAGGWVAGARFSQSPAAQASGGFDIGAATQPRPTGKVRAFQLVAKEAPWEIAPGVTVPAITYNGQVPGPLIRVTEGDTLRVTIKNELNQATAIHWHRLHHTENDGVEPGGLIQVIQYEGYTPPNSGAAPAAPTAMPANMPGMAH